MKTVKKILVVHGNDRSRRRIVIALADAGYDLRACIGPDAGLDTARGEWFDLAVVDASLAGADDFAFATALRRIQPTVPVILLVPSLELPVIIKGIRMGLADVLVEEDDPRPFLRRVHALLQPNRPESAGDGLTPEELDEAESALARYTSATPFKSNDVNEELVRGTRERAEMEARIQRLTHEKAAVEAELRTLLSQNADAGRMQAELEGLHAEREMADAAQAAIDAKARQLAETRAEIARERDALEAARKQIADATPIHSRSEQELADERATLDKRAAELHTEQARLHEQAGLLVQETTRIAQERRRWHDDLDLLAAQEENLRAYEQRLRELQARLESDRVLWFQQRDEPSRSPFKDNAALREAWEKLQRATELFESDQAVFREERMALRAQEIAVKKREDALRLSEAKLAEHEKQLLGLKPANPSALTRSPFQIFGRGKS